jgi:hypothetical protein
LRAPKIFQHDIIIARLVGLLNCKDDGDVSVNIFAANVYFI